MRDTITVVEALGTSFRFSSIAFWVNYVCIPILFGWLGYRLKGYLNKAEMGRLRNSEEKANAEVGILKERLQQVKLEKARGESDNINLGMEIEKMKEGERRKS